MSDPGKGLAASLSIEFAALDYTAVVTGPPLFLDTPIAASYDVVNKAKESAFKRRAIWLMTPGIGFFRA
jgi:hypothetical protein